MPVYENHSRYPEERNEIISFIEQENIKNVIFLTGDRHFTELSLMDRSSQFPLLDYTSSTFTAGFFHRACEVEKNFLRVDRTCYAGRNFGMIEISGKKDQRSVKLLCYDSNGKLIWERIFNEIDY